LSGVRIPELPQRKDMPPMPLTRPFRRLCTALLLAVAVPAAAEVRIKDIATFEGVRENQLVGYGLVVGLNGTGDRLRNSPLTQKSIEGMLSGSGSATCRTTT
jgi:flagellar P-ring protein precursor FlgI